jgi:histidine triad (HIT) family protein
LLIKKKNRLRGGLQGLSRRLVRSLFVARILLWMINALPFALPVSRLRETDTLLAFFHPQPAYAYHVILLSRKPIRSLVELEPRLETAFLTDLFTMVQSLVAEYQLPAYRLIVNGGEFQDFPYLHFHLVSDMASPQHTSPRLSGEDS